MLYKIYKIIHHILIKHSQYENEIKIIFCIETNTTKWNRGFTIFDIT